MTECHGVELVELLRLRVRVIDRDDREGSVRRNPGNMPEGLGKVSGRALNRPHRSAPARMQLPLEHLARLVAHLDPAVLDR
eukprot:5069054-Heterocapsa_arctica.AAC.1